MARRDSFISPRVIFSCGFVWNTRKVTQTKRNFEKNKKASGEQRGETEGYFERWRSGKPNRLLFRAEDMNCCYCQKTSIWGNETSIWEIWTTQSDSFWALTTGLFFHPMNEKKNQCKCPGVASRTSIRKHVSWGGSAPTGNDSLSHGRIYFSETLSFNLHSIRTLLFGFSTFIRQQILRLSRLFRGNSPGTFSWTSNIPATSYICTVCGIYKDSWHSWLVRQPFQNLKKKKKKGTETSVSWFARGLDELCCRWPLRVIHGFHRTSDWRSRCCFFLPGLWRNTWCEERP